MKAQCPARGAVCRKCSKKGHFQAMCRTERTVGTINRESEDDISLGTVNASADTVSSTESPWVINLTLNGHPVQFKIDTGADVTVIGETDVILGLGNNRQMKIWYRSTPNRQTLTKLRQSYKWKNLKISLM